MKTFLLVACWIVYSVVARNPSDPSIDGIENNFETADDFQEWNDDPSGDFNGNLVKRNILQIFESLEETEKDLPNRVFFYLYTRDNANDPQQLFVDDINALNNSNFDAERDTKFVTHGWRSSYKDPVCQLVLEAFLQNSDCNVILIDWSKIAKNEYFWTSDRIEMIGKYAAKMVSFLQSHGLKGTNLTVVGHSLGAHVAGLTSNYSTEKANYVVGLDPAGPSFYLRHPNYKLSRGQGKFVEVIHSDAGLAGVLGDLGDADFWPDGGQIQVGCTFIDAVICSHSRSYIYFAESINTNIGFVGIQCPNYIQYLGNKCANNPIGIMGGAAPQPGLSGNYFLTTNANSPYARGYPS